MFHRHAPPSIHHEGINFAHQSKQASAKATSKRNFLLLPFYLDPCQYLMCSSMAPSLSSHQVCLEIWPIFFAKHLLAVKQPNAKTRKPENFTKYNYAQSGAEIARHVQDGGSGRCKYSSWV